MALYAQDAAETVEPWVRWEYQSESSGEWVPCVQHPVWNTAGVYRRALTQSPCSL